MIKAKVKYKSWIQKLLSFLFNIENNSNQLHLFSDKRERKINLKKVKSYKEVIIMLIY